MNKQIIVKDKETAIFWRKEIANALDIKEKYHPDVSLPYIEIMRIDGGHSIVVRRISNPDLLAKIEKQFNRIPKNKIIQFENVIK